ncbi:hypothetical protein FQA39_LY02960 [Lamprigera yunnana]|nr:hypothetical protein FQA39_LY02960 [Lamprigera yunnana]
MYFGYRGNGGTSSSSLNFVDLITISNSECTEEFNSTFIVQGTLYARGHPEHNVCKGDSGGPLVVYDDNGKATHVGTSSFVHINGCSSGKHGGFARTSYFIPWITELTGPI